MRLLLMHLSKIFFLSVKESFSPLDLTRRFPCSSVAFVFYLDSQMFFIGFSKDFPKGE